MGDPSRRGLRAIVGAVESRVLEPVDRALSKMALLGILDKLAKLGILVAAVTYIVELDDRREAKRQEAVRSAWQTINGAAGVGGSGGVEAAVRQLIELEEPLSGINLSHAWLLGTKSLKGQGLIRAYLDNAVLLGADLRGAVLDWATLREAVLVGAKLSKCSLRDAVMERARLSTADLREAGLPGAVLSGADLSSADLRRAKLTGARLDGANLAHAKLAGADLSGADLSAAVNLTQEQVDSARCSQETLLPAGITRPSAKP